jgi:molybdate transport system ATP-binding protein
MSRCLSVALSGRLGQLALDLRLESDLDGLTLITGPSGAGKTTLLRCVSGLTRLPGRIAVDGATWQDGPRSVPAHRREVGHVFQDNRLFSHLSVADNLRFGARRTTPGGKGQTKGGGLGWDEVVALLNLAPLLGRSVQGLSGGEQQRVAIGRTLLARPQLVLMDEPTASLDADARREVTGLVGRLVSSLDTPVLLVSHDPAGFLPFARRRVRMADGRITGVEVLSAADRDPLAGYDTAARDALARAALAAGLAPDPG